MGIYISIPTTMLLIIGLALAAGHLDSRSKDQKAYEEGVALCERSHCKPECGTFGHNGLNRVMYNPSYCEMQFQRQEAEENAKKLDAEIRAKFKDGGQ